MTDWLWGKTGKDELMAEAKRQELVYEALPCRVCGETPTPEGRTCDRCSDSIEEDRLRRELGQ